MNPSSIRKIAVAASAAMLLGAFVAGPADAKKKKKRKPVVTCPAYVSPEWAGEAATTMVTDAATADKPVEVAIETHEGFGFTSADGPDGDTGATSHVFQNVQVNTAASSAKLFVRAEYAEAFDYDLFLRLPDVTAVAYEADFNPATVAGATPIGGYEGGSAEPGASQIDGFTGTDCAGYTVDLASGISPGGEVTLKFWLEQ